MKAVAVSLFVWMQGPTERSTHVVQNSLLADILSEIIESYAQTKKLEHEAHPETTGTFEKFRAG